MKIEIASKLVCPFMSTDCITIGCMAWAFKEEKVIEPQGVFTHPKGTKSDGYNKDNRLIWYKVTDKGYCKRVDNGY